MGKIREPPDHRFRVVLELLDDFLPLKSVIKNNYSEAKMFGKKKDDKTSDEWIDQSSVTAALTSEAWWGYGVMVEAVGHAPQHIVYFSRTCVCHKSTEQEELYSDTMSYARANRRQGRKLLCHHCVCKGMCGRV